MMNGTPIFSMNRSRVISNSVLLLFALATLHACGGSSPDPEPVVSIHTSPVKRGPIALAISAEAVVFPLQQAVITPKITSTIKKFYVQRGSPVKQGQLLAELENSDLAGAAKQSKGEFEQAEAGYATTTGASLPQQIQKAELDAAALKFGYDAQKKIYDARKNLFDQGAIPRRELDSAEVALAQAHSQNEQAQKQLSDLQRLGKEQTLKSAGGQLSAASGKYQNAKAQLSYSQIRSPIDGVVTDRPLFQGELATANQPILTVMNISKLIAKAHISQEEAVQLRVGNPAELKLEGLDEAISGRVTLVSPALDPGSTTVEIWVEPAKLNPALKPGMNVQIAIVAKSVKDALVVPASAVYKTEQGESYILLAGPDHKAHRVKVKIGILEKEFAEIIGALKVNDQVITQGGYAVPDGTKISIEVASADEGKKESDSGQTDAKPGLDGVKKPAAAATPKDEE
jgi:HlyD family secretion protein